MSEAAYTICVIPGDGIGPEVTGCAEQVLQAAVATTPGAPAVRFTHAEAGHGAFLRTGEALPAATLAAARAADGVLVGAMDGAAMPAGAPNPIRLLRQGLQVHASLRPARSFAGVETARDGVDLLVVREVTEGLYSGQEHRVEPDGAAALRVVTHGASARTAEIAFAQARLRRGRVTAVHKISALKLTDSIFLQAAEEVAGRYPEVEFGARTVDTCAMELVQHPERFDVILATNAFGDILSDVAAGLTGGVGLAPSGCVGPRWSFFEPVHGTAPGRVGQARANPLATVLSAAMMLRHLGQEGLARRVERAVQRVLDGGPRTSDLGGQAGSAELTDAVLAALSAY